MVNYETLNALSKAELIELLGIYSKDWLAMDGYWFQSIERSKGMDEAMRHNIEVWSGYTVTEAKRIKKFLGLDDHPGLEGLKKALSLRLYANINEAEISIKGNTLTYTTMACSVQDARNSKGLPYHPCKAVGIVEYGNFAKTIDSRITTECISCYPDITDNSCHCKWEFTLHE